MIGSELSLARVSVEPAEGSLLRGAPRSRGFAPASQPRENHTFVALAGLGVMLMPGFARRVLANSPPKFISFMLSEYTYKLNKTFNNGSLGSGIDEERSEMR